MKWQARLLKVEEVLESRSLVLRLRGGGKRVLPPGSGIDVLMALMGDRGPSAADISLLHLFARSEPEEGEGAITTLVRDIATRYGRRGGKAEEVARKR